jgi:ATP-dependent Lon protease
MTVIHCGGYTENDKKVILKDYIWPQLLDRLKFTVEDVVLTDMAIKHIITEYSGEEKGVRTLIRTVESMMTRRGKTLSESELTILNHIHTNRESF